jgi:hypothetical protein
MASTKYDAISVYLAIDCLIILAFNAQVDFTTQVYLKLALVVVYLTVNTATTTNPNASSVRVKITTILRQIAVILSAMS